MDHDEHYMQEAFREAERARMLGEVPVGAVLVRDGEIVARGHNLRENLGDPTAHAEMVVLRSLANPNRPERWRYHGVTAYVTMEPCFMCMGAMVQARVDRVVFSAYDPKGGAAESLAQLGCDPRLNHSIDVCGGVLEQRGSTLLKDFFSKAREDKRLRRAGRAVEGA